MEEKRLMSTTDSPAVARYRVRLALRAAREAKQLTQTQVADAMDWSLSKVMRIEKGEVTVAGNDLKVLLGFLDVSEPSEVQRLLDEARASRQQRWTVEAADREFLTPSMIELYQFEAAATTVRAYNNFVIPGRLQTHAYARALFAPHREQLGAALVEARIEARIQSQQLLYRPDAPRYLVLLDEAVLMRPIGGAAVMAEQLERALQLIRQTSVRIGIVPLVSAATSLYFYGPFALCDLDDSRSAFLYRENNQSDEAVHSTEDIDRHRRAFEQMWSIALDESAARERIESAVDQLRSGGG
jgi:transcriptional regulator with XRE-family HTH domain